MNRTIITIGAAFIAGCLTGIGALKGAEIMANRFKKRKADEIYYYECLDADNGEDVVDAVISDNKLVDFLTAIIDVTVNDPTITIERDECQYGFARVTFEATYEEHLKILEKAGIEYKIEEE